MTRTLLFSLILSAVPDVGLGAALLLWTAGRKGATAASGQLQPMEILGKLQLQPKPCPNSGLLQVLSPSLMHDALFPPLVCPILTLGREAGKPKKQVNECRAAQGSGAESGHSAGARMAEPTKLGLVQPWCPWRSCDPSRKAGWAFCSLHWWQVQPENVFPPRGYPALLWVRSLHHLGWDFGVLDTGEHSPVLVPPPRAGR